MENEVENKSLSQNHPIEVPPAPQERPSTTQNPALSLSPPQTLKPNKSKKWLFVSLAIILAIGLGTAGAWAYQKYQSKESVPPTQPSPTPTLTAQASPTPIGAIDQQLSAAHNSFGFKIFQNLTRQNTDKNIFISPSSIALALSMTYNGAEAETKEAMAKTLEIQNMTLEETNQASQNLIGLLKNPDEKVTISIANSIWARQGIEFKPEFMADNQKYYQAEVTSLDFGNPTAVEIINTWVNNNTNGKIPTIIDPPIPAEMVMYLINAIYFKGTWTWEFDPELTKNREFTLADSSKKMVPMMEQKETFPYLETDDFQAVSLPYGENKRLRMDIFLPKNNLAQFLQGLNLNQWNQWLNQFQKTEGTIIMPKFKVEYEKELNDSLKALGMEICFNPERANFGRMANLEELLGNLFISKVKHKTFIEVNEEGTEAAAVTSVGLGITAISEESTFSMEINRPFFFAIRDSQTEAILFMGIIQNL